ncbi:MAG: hypothetical protein LBC17_04195 [Lactobacillaceae bacterium]|jgi:hypothetical protein|nr:hypothetical protein [Lactobacillaceae bacterium]
MDGRHGDQNRYMNGATLAKQLSLYNGTVPFKKEPEITTLNKIVASINFMEEHDVTDHIGFLALKKTSRQCFERGSNKS